MAAILIIYATVDGHTHTICRRLQQSLEDQAHQVTLMPIDQAENADLTPFDKIVLGSSIRYGKHHPLAVHFIKTRHAELARKPSAFFSVNIVARKPEKNTPDTNPYLQKLLRQIVWRPDLLAVFAGKLNYPIYGPLDKFMIRLIMKITKGPTDPATVTEFTDWQQVELFARQVADL